VILAGGIIWFDYLNVIDAKALMAPALRLAGRTARRQQPASGDLNLDAERLAARLEALDMRSRDMEKQEQDLRSRKGEIEQMAQELEERQKALDEREKSLEAQQRERENKERNVEQNSRYLTGMNPAQAVGIIAAMDDQDIVDVFRKTEEIAQAEGGASMVSYWLSLLPPERAAEIQRKMAGRPQGF
jgi:flagellar protein FlbB